MPLDPRNIYTEVVHEKTQHDTNKGWRYGCHNRIFHPPAWANPKPAQRNCGHLQNLDDPACEGCYRRDQDAIDDLGLQKGV